MHENLNGHSRGSNMKEVTGLFVFVLTFLAGRADGIEPNSGFCIGTQCFTVFQEPSDFTAAQTQCSDQGGHLMTVRSTVSHDILSILLGNSTGRFWIGLHLTSGCPDAAAALKGFQWVTKDSVSDWFNWAPSFDSSCSSHRCVSVSPEDDLKWIQEPCEEDVDGFLCEYSFSDPCKDLTVADGETVTYRTPMGIVGEDLLSLPPGSTAIRMPAKTKYICFSEQWLQAPWSCEIHLGGCEYKCAVTPNNVPSCYCPPGQTINPANKVTCEASADDPCLPLRCAHACYKKGDSYACMCDHGFKLARDGRSCTDFTDCRDKRKCPGENFKCVSVTEGFQCVCKDGYKMRGGLCVDVDECASAPCEHRCANSPGGYTCSCDDGYKEDPKSSNKCILHCGKEECAAECDPNDQFQCFCPEGYILEEREGHSFCIDLDECSSDNCDQGCKNTFGSYVCTCYAGYKLVEEFRCVKRSEGDGDTDGGLEGSGAGTTPNMPTVSAAPYPEPTRQPSVVTVGGLVGIIVCTVFVIVLVVCLAHHILSGRGKSAGELKAPEGEAHGLHQVTSDA
ncbi:thrombomodulin-like isoform X1 [Sander lucioperca]|uniref:thrombomodulin-like isoform X1 n=1 Tax=Sander lucioperca TaxID=283035 RepID=UPI00125D0190|nr:thrombomodulin-like isoform X1 [Sander lucioperca]